MFTNKRNTYTHSKHTILSNQHKYKPNDITNTHCETTHVMAFKINHD